MLDSDTFLTTLYVLADDFCQSQPQPDRPGPAPALSPGEVVTLAVFGQWGRFASERDFYRFADQRLRPAVPTLPDRSQFNRLQRAAHDRIAAFGLDLAQRLGGATAPYEALDATAVPVRNRKRRGWGWLGGQVAIGWSTSLGWYEGFHLLLSVTPTGIITGYAFGAANVNERALAETFFATRQRPHPRLPTVGPPAPGPYLGDTGFNGRAQQRHWAEAYDAPVICAPQRNHAHAWLAEGHRWLAHYRQIIETVNDKLHAIFRLRRERPHALDGFQARLAAKVALHNLSIWLNRQRGCADLAFADLLAW